MTAVKAQAVQILQDIPDEKVSSIIEVLEGLRLLYMRSGDAIPCNETPADVMGICGKYANPELIPIEKEAWSEAVKEKHDTY